MRPLVFHEPTAEIMFGVSLAAWFAIELAVRVRSGSQVSSSREWTLSLIVLALIGSILVGAELAGAHTAPLPDGAWWPVIAGLALLWAGVAFRLWAIITLGRFFKMVVVVQENHRVVDRGPYRWLRHPSYTGGMAIAIGIGLAEGDWASLAIMFVCPLIAFLIRIRVEERMLLEELGDEYAAYTQRTARLLPGIY